MWTNAQDRSIPSRGAQILRAVATLATVVAFGTASADEPQGSIYFGSPYEGATISLDGQAVDARPPVLVGQLSAGKHDIEVRTACARAQGTIDVELGQVMRFEAPMIKGDGRVMFTSDPVGAEVMFDGQSIGHTPVTIDRACGAHHVTLRMIGYHDLALETDVRAYDVVRLDPVLERYEFGVLVVVPSPVNASVTLDGEALGEGPRTLPKVLAGTHDLVAHLDGYEDTKRSVVVEPNATVQVAVALSPAIAAPIPPVVQNESRISNLRVGRLAANGGTLVGGGVLSYLGVRSWGNAREAYDRYMAAEEDAEAARIYADDVGPARTRSYVELGAGTGLLGLSAYLWATTGSVVVTPTSATFTGRW